MFCKTIAALEDPDLGSSEESEYYEEILEIEVTTSEESDEESEPEDVPKIIEEVDESASSGDGRNSLEEDLNGSHARPLRRRPLPEGFNSSIPFGFEGDECENEENDYRSSENSDDDMSDYSSSEDEDRRPNKKNSHKGTNGRIIKASKSDGSSNSENITGDQIIVADVSTNGFATENETLTMESETNPKSDCNETQECCKELLELDQESLCKYRKEIEPLLVAYLPVMRWIPTSPTIKDAFAAYSEKKFLESFCSMLTLLKMGNWFEILNDLSISELLKEDWANLMSGENAEKLHLFEWELPEDRSMIGLPVFKEYTTPLKYKNDLTEDDKVLA